MNFIVKEKHIILKGDVKIQFLIEEVNFSDLKSGDVQLRK